MLDAKEKAKEIRLFILDVDGILTDGYLYYSAQGEELKCFYVQDGLGMKLLQQSGVKLAIISAKKSAAVEQRLKILNVEHIYLGLENKIPAYEKLQCSLQLKNQQIAYMGDDLPDLPLLKRSGLAITVPQAPTIIRQYANLVTNAAAGKGAVREACEFIMNAQNQYEKMIQSYLENA